MSKIVLSKPSVRGVFNFDEGSNIFPNLSWTYWLAFIGTIIDFIDIKLLLGSHIIMPLNWRWWWNHMLPWTKIDLAFASLVEWDSAPLVDWDSAPIMDYLARDSCYCSTKMIALMVEKLALFVVEVIKEIVMSLS